MGSPHDEAERRKDEELHKVALRKGFWLEKYEVTQEEWERFSGRSLDQQK